MARCGRACASGRAVPGRHQVGVALRGPDPGTGRRAGCPGRRGLSRRHRRERSGSAAGHGAQGRGHVRHRPGPRDSAAHPAGVHGGQLLRVVDVVVGRGAHPQGPRPRHQRPRRADRRGHRRLRADAVLAAAQPRHPASAVAAGVHAAAQTRTRCAPTSTSPTSASTSPTSSSSATAWTTPSATATCPTSARSTPRCTRTVRFAETAWAEIERKRHFVDLGGR